MIRELDRVRLTVDLPDLGLSRDQPATIVHVYDHGAGYEAEFLSPEGDTVAVVTLKADQIRPDGDLPEDCKIADSAPIRSPNRISSPELSKP